MRAAPTSRWIIGVCFKLHLKIDGKQNSEGKGLIFCGRRWSRAPNGSMARTNISQDVQTRFPVQMAFAKFLSKKRENF